MIRNGRRVLTHADIQYEAPRHARFMSMFADGDRDKVAKAIQSKGELYSLSKFPDQEVVRQARNDFDGFRMGTPAMQQIGADMQRFYGLNSGQPVTRELVSEANQQPAQALYQSATARQGPPAQHPVSLEEGIAIAQKRANPKQAAIPDPFGEATVPRQRAQEPLGPQENAYPESMPAGPNPAQQAANDLKDDWVNHTVGYDVQKRYDDLLIQMESMQAAQRQKDELQQFIDQEISEQNKYRGMFSDNQALDMTLTGAGLLGSGALLDRAFRGGKEEEEEFDPRYIR